MKKIDQGSLFSSVLGSIASPKLFATIRALSASGRSRAEIAAALDCTSDPSVVGSIQAVLGDPVPRPSGISKRN